VLLRVRFYLFFSSEVTRKATRTAKRKEGEDEFELKFEFDGC